ncbi:unnamed protein product [Prorocentrum cordatum]|uniref:Uncharacterized protein n=1 Tax=Prorocentrum cordatum TaxID=2364126 RepID=A0ABN9U235_9DINO|nr:unnamed protein product [Polarella glacialis]
MARQPQVAALLVALALLAAVDGTGPTTTTTTFNPDYIKAPEAVQSAKGDHAAAGVLGTIIAGSLGLLVAGGFVARPPFGAPSKETE